LIFTNVLLRFKQRKFHVKITPIYVLPGLANVECNVSLEMKLHKNNANTL